MRFAAQLDAVDDARIALRRLVANGILGGLTMYAAYRDAQYPRLHGERILIVEDEALVSMLVEDAFLEAGAEVVGPACTLDEALQLTETTAAEGGLSAAVLDINLAGQTVWPVADRLASLGIPFVFSTGYDDGRNSHHHAEAPRLVKPFDLDTLVAMVRQLTLRGSALEATATCRQAIQPALS
jgi:DNA-binding response OmpR family regulator